MAAKGKNNRSWVESPIKNEQVLREELFVNGLSFQQIADKYGVSKRTVARWVHRFEIVIDLKERNEKRTKRIKLKINPKLICPKCDGKKSRGAKTCFSCRDISGENNGMFGKTHSEASMEPVREAQRERMSGEGNPMNNPQSVLKVRLKAIERIENRVGQMCPNYNPEAVKMIEAYGKENGYNFQHAENGGEFRIKSLGYWLDGYDPEKNVAIEFYEAHHKKQVEKDKARKELIIKELGCEFIELKSWD